MQYFKIILIGLIIVVSFKLAKDTKKNDPLESVEYCSQEIIEQDVDRETVICIPGREIDLGDVRPEIINHTFEIFNQGNYPLVVKYVKVNSG